jgi:DNA-binding transcriptional regulator GbsR (MarR family)
MAVFGRKKKKKRKGVQKREFVPPVDVQSIHANIPSGPLPTEVKEELGQIKDMSEDLTPVFVKVSKYRDILNSVNYVRMGFNLIKNQIAILSKLQKLQRQNMELLYTALEKVSTQLTKLDSDFTKPVDFMKEVSEMKLEDVKGLEKTIGDLKSQIEQLRGNVEAMA